MAAVDFITALGRVLHDGTLRDAFAHDATAFVKTIDLRESDQASFLRLSPTDLEVQARVLLRKRFDQVRRLLPRTCQALGKSAWEHFVVSVRSSEAYGNDTKVQDAYRFCTHVARVQTSGVCAREFNRCRFAISRRGVSLHLVKESGRIPAIQLFVRLRGERWREWRIYAGV